MANSASERLRFTKQEFHDALCRLCQYPDNPTQTCQVRRNGLGVCEKCEQVARSTCRKTSLSNESIYQGY
jgi:hypothetical protein